MAGMRKKDGGSGGTKNAIFEAQLLN